MDPARRRLVTKTSARKRVLSAGGGKGKNAGTTKVLPVSSLKEGRGKNGGGRRRAGTKRLRSKIVERGRDGGWRVPSALKMATL